MCNNTQNHSRSYKVTIGDSNGAEGEKKFLEAIKDAKNNNKIIEIEYSGKDSNYVYEREYSFLRNGIYTVAENSFLSQGTIYFLWGNLEDDSSKYEWGRFFYVVKWLSKKRFKVIVNPYALTIDAHLALSDPEIKVFVWSGHGDDEGILFDKEYQTLPTDIFYQSSSSLRQIVLSSCFGERIMKKYQFRSDYKVYRWDGETNSKEFLDFFLSPDWTEKLSQDLGIEL